MCCICTCVIERATCQCHLSKSFANSLGQDEALQNVSTGPMVIKRVFMLNSTEHEIYPAH